MQNAVITGALSGMGYETTKLFLDRGWNVLMVDAVDNKEVIDEIQNQYGIDRAPFFKCNLANAAEVKGMAAYAMKRFGKIDSLLNIAGIFFKGRLHEVPEENWDKIFDVDVKSIYLTGKYLIPSMIENGGGTIVNVASVDGMFGAYNMSSYNAAKGAVVNMTRSMALDYARDGIRTNCVCPGACATPMFKKNPQEKIDEFNNANPMGRLSEPIEVAKSIYFMASDESSYCNGAILMVTGGLDAYSGEPVQR